MQMSTADLDNVTEGVGLGFKGVMQFLQGREKGMGYFGDCSYVHHGWKAVEIQLSKIGEGGGKPTDVSLEDWDMLTWSLG